MTVNSTKGIGNVLERVLIRVRFLRYLWGKVDDLQPLLFSVVHRIDRPAVLFGEIADTHAAVIHQTAVPLVHTAFGVFLTQEAFADKIGQSWSFVAKIESLMLLSILSPLGHSSNLTLDNM